MLDNYISKKQLHVCSIEDLNEDSNKEELLLSNRNQTILEEDEEELFSLYITPYSEKSNQQSKIRDFSVNQDTTIIKGNTHREESLHNKCQEYEAEIHRLKKILMKKNAVIGDLTQQLKIYFQHSKKHQSKRLRQPNQQKQQQCTSHKCRSEMNFFQKNNLELYEQLQAEKNKTKELSAQLAKAEEYHSLCLKVQNLQKQNAILRQQNSQLLKSTKKYLSQGDKQIKIITKMRQVLAQKLSLKEMNLQLPQYNPKPSAPTKTNYERRKQPKKRNKQEQIRARTLQRQQNKQNRIKQRSYSHEPRKII